MTFWSLFRWDLTDDKRYSLNAASEELVASLEAPVEVTIYLDGDLNSGFQRLKRATEELVDELDVYGDVSWRIGEGKDLEARGLTPTLVHERAKDGRTAQTAVWPYATVTYKGRTTVIPLLRSTRGQSGEENLNQSIENLEYAFAEAIYSLRQTEPMRIAFLEGHNELPEEAVYDISLSLSRYFQIDRGVLGTDPTMLDPYKVVIIADPQTPFSETDKYILDRYIQQGGSILWCVNGVRLSQDALTKEGFTPVLPLDLNISDLLFRYGVRINASLVQDVQCLPIPVNVSSDPQQPNYQPLPWYYAPLLLTSQQSPITRNVGQVSATFVSHVDAVGGDDGLEKEVLLATSTASRFTATPAEVDLGDLNPDLESFKYGFIPVALRIEGVFPSLFAHRLPPEGIETASLTAHRQASPDSIQMAKQIIVASGSVIRNEWQGGEPLPVGYDRYSRMQFGNRDFLTNAVLYLADDEGLIALRGKEVALRLINTERAYKQRALIQTLSILLPILLLAITGLSVLLIRRKRYQ